jgi:hypothetical protein
MIKVVPVLSMFEMRILCETNSRRQKELSKHLASKDYI